MLDLIAFACVAYADSVEENMVKAGLPNLRAIMSSLLSEGFDLPFQWLES